MHRRPTRAVCVFTLTLVCLAFAACGGEDSAKPAAAPADTLIDGGPAAFKARLARLKGTPVVVNQWASWCGPCRYEFPFFGSQAERLKGRVAFLGVNSKDARQDALDFLARYPVPFEHFFDADAAIARVFRGGRSWPTTAFYDAEGDLAFTRQGGYASEQDLVDDIERYALGG